LDYKLAASRSGTEIPEIVRTNNTTLLS